MAIIKAPFNFVPLNDKVFFPDWADKISQDIPFEDGEDGIITVEIKNMTPLFIRDGHPKDRKTEWSCHIIDENGNKKFYIPGSTLKGCFRNVLEIISFSKLNRYNNDSFGYRSFTTQIRGVNYSEKMKAVNGCGWLYKEGDDYYIEECANGIQKIRHYDLRKKFPCFKSGADHQTAECKQKSLKYNTDGELYPTISINGGELSYKDNNTQKQVPKGSYKVVCTGYMQGKNVEYLFSERLNSPIPVSDEVFNTFDTVHQHTPYYAGQNGKDGFLKNRLKNGFRIPVFFEKRGDQICAIGITRMFRYPFDNSVSKSIEHTTKDHFSPKLDLSDVIFGYISKAAQLKGRVHIGNAFSDDIVTDDVCSLETGVFGQPRASYYPLYIKQTGNTISNYSTKNVVISGRKRYRITKNGMVLPLSKGNGNENLLVSFRPLPKGLTFKCHISVHNLNKVEIGALLSAITFNNTPECYHNLGLAKSFGYGAVACKAILSKSFKYSMDDYLKDFNEEISCFLQQNGSSLQSENVLKNLVSIASATHTAEEMVQMSFDECEKFKEDRHFSRLTEQLKSYNVAIDEKNALISKTKKQFSNLKKEIRTTQIEETIGKLKEFRPKLYLAGLSDCLEELDSIIIQYEKLLTEQIRLEEEKKQNDKFNSLCDEYTAQLAICVGKLCNSEDCNNALTIVEKAEQLYKSIHQMFPDKELIDKHSDLREQIKNKKTSITTGEGLSFLLKQRVDGNGLLISDMPNGVGRINQFLKKYPNYVFSDNDKSTIEQWLKAIPVPTKKANLKDFNDINGKSWQQISKFVGSDTASQWFHEITGQYDTEN